jgi:hypothetical protein
MATAAVKELVGMPTLPITKGLMSKISETPTPGGYIGPKETLGSEQELLAQKGVAEQTLGKADIEVERAKQQQKTSELDIDAQSKRELVESLRKLPEKTALDEGREKLKNNAFVPTKDTVQDIAGLFSLINVIGMAIGGGGKRNAQMAMYAMNGMAEGYQKGKTDLYRKEQIEFDKNFKAMQAAVQTLEKEYAEAVDLEKTDKEAGRIARQVALARQTSPVLKAMEDRLGPAKTLETIKDLSKSTNTAVDKFNSLKKIEEDKLAKQRAEAAIERRHQETLKQARDLAAIKAGAQIGDLGAYIQKFTGSAVSKKDAPEIMAAANAIGDAYGIKQTVAEHPEWVGRTGQIKNFFNRTLESINAGTPSPDDAGQPELIFAKRYAEYLVNYERALAGGARGFTVAFQKRFNALLDQNQFNAAGMSNLMDEQSRTIASKAAEKSPTLNRQNLTAMAYDLKNRSEDEMAVKGMQSLLGGSSTPTVREFSTVEDAEKANLPKGTKIKIGGRNATVE